MQCKLQEEPLKLFDKLFPAGRYKRIASRTLVECKHENITEYPIEKKCAATLETLSVI